MKVSISIPDPLFRRIETFLKNARISRSEFFQCAAKSYLDEVYAKAIAKNLNEIHSGDEDPDDTAFRRAALIHARDRVLEEW